VCHPGTGTTPTPTPAVVDLKPDGSCPEGYYKTGSTKYPCLKNASTTTTTQTGSTGAGGTTTTGGGTTTATPEPPTELEVPKINGGSCPGGSHSVGSSGSAGQPGTGSVTCLAQKTEDGSFILPSFPAIPAEGDLLCYSGYVKVDTNTCVLNISCPAGMTKIGTTQCVPNKLLPATTTTTALPAQTSNGGVGGTTTTPMKTGTTTGAGGTTTTTTNPATTTTTSKPPTSTTTTTTTTSNVINRGGSSTAGGGNAAAAPAQGANTFLTYVNAVNKLTIKYPSTWTKTDLVGNPSIPVMFSAPTAIIAAAGNTPATKTSFVISITPSASNLDSFMRQQINTLTNSKAIKYTITDTNAKVLTPPTGITAFREVSYDAVKNNNIPLKGAAIFFVNGGTGYSLLYLAKQVEFTQNLPVIQQMVNSFQIGAAANSGGPVQNVAAASGAR
jgi:hypothetical protein